MSDSISAKVIFNVFKVSFLVIGLLLLSIAWLLNKDNLAQDSWPTVKGKVFYSQVVEHQKDFLGRKVKWYDLNIKYGYAVDNIRYDKKGLFLKSNVQSLDLSFFKEKVKEFKKGKVVDVHYNPENPKQAYLVANIDEGTRSFYKVAKDIVLFALFLFAITPLIGLFKEKRFKEKNKVESGLVVPDDVKRIQPLSKHR